MSSELAWRPISFSGLMIGIFESVYQIHVPVSIRG